MSARSSAARRPAPDAGAALRARAAKAMRDFRAATPAAKTLPADATGRPRLAREALDTTDPADVAFQAMQEKKAQDRKREKARKRVRTKHPGGVPLRADGGFEHPWMRMRPGVPDELVPDAPNADGKQTYTHRARYIADPGPDVYKSREVTATDFEAAAFLAHLGGTILALQDAPGRREASVWWLDRIHAAFRAAHGYDAIDAADVREARMIAHALRWGLCEEPRGIGAALERAWGFLQERRAAAWLTRTALKQALRGGTWARGGAPRRGERGRRSVEAVALALVNEHRAKAKRSKLPRSVLP